MVFDPSSLSFFETQVQSVEVLEPYYCIIRLKKPDRFQHKAGQHTIFRFQDAENLLYRTYSIASEPEMNSSLEFCVQLYGDEKVSHFLRELETGQSVQISAAQGSFHLLSGRTPQVFVAGGSGIGPLRSFIKSQLSQSTSPPLLLIYGCRDAHAFPFLEEFKQLEKQHQGRLKALFFAEAGTAPGVKAGRVTEAFQIGSAQLIADAHYYLCGPPRDVRRSQSYLGRKSDY